MEKGGVNVITVMYPCIAVMDCSVKYWDKSECIGPEQPVAYLLLNELSLFHHNNNILDVNICRYIRTYQVNHL